MLGLPAGAEIEVLQGNALGAEKRFVDAQHAGTGDAIESVAKDRVDKLVDEQGRRVADSTADKISISSFKRFMPEQMIAERN